MSSSIAITGLQLASPNARPWGREALLAYFNFAYCGIAVSGCALVQRKSGVCVVALPRIPGRDRHDRAITLETNELRFGIVEAAVATYRALGGKETSKPSDLALTVGPNSALLQSAYKPETFGNWFRSQCAAAGLSNCSAHGLRKAGATRLANAGATEFEVMAFLGHKTPDEARTTPRKLTANALLIQTWKSSWGQMRNRNYPTVSKGWTTIDLTA